MTRIYFKLTVSLIIKNPHLYRVSSLQDILLSLFITRLVTCQKMEESQTRTSVISGGKRHRTKTSPKLTLTGTDTVVDAMKIEDWLHGVV